MAELCSDYKRLVNALPDAVVIHVSGKIIFANPAALKIIGAKKRSGLIDRTIYSFVLPDFVDEVKSRVRKVEKGGSVPFSRIKIRRIDGRIVHAETKGIPVLFKGMRAVLVIIRDLTQYNRFISQREINMALKKEISHRLKTENNLITSEKNLNVIFQQAYIGIAKVDLNGRFITVNEQLCKIMGYSAAQLCRMTFFDITHPDDIPISENVLNEFIKKKYIQKSFEKRYIHKNGSIVHVELTISLICDRRGKPEYFISVTNDITRRKEKEKEIHKSLQQKETLLKEVHHRVKNNLQVICSLLNMQSSLSHDEATINLLKESQNRIKTMALIHENLYGAIDASKIQIAGYLSNLSEHIIHSLSTNDKQIDLTLDVDEEQLNVDTALSCGLIINELVSNSILHAFHGRQKGKINIGMKRKMNDLILTVEDDGNGFPEHIDYKNTDTLGLQLVNILAQQINGNISMRNKKGTLFSLTITPDK